jgi:hypothetical protein
VEGEVEPWVRREVLDWVFDGCEDEGTGGMSEGASVLVEAEAEADIVRVVLMYG